MNVVLSNEDVYYFALLISNFNFVYRVLDRENGIIITLPPNIPTAFNSKLLQGCYFCVLAVSVFCYEMYEFPREKFLLRGFIHQWLVEGFLNYYLKHF